MNYFEIKNANKAERRRKIGLSLQQKHLCENGNVIKWKDEVGRKSPSSTYSAIAPFFSFYKSVIFPSMANKQKALSGSEIRCPLKVLWELDKKGQL